MIIITTSLWFCGSSKPTYMYILKLKKPSREWCGYGEVITTKATTIPRNFFFTNLHNSNTYKHVYKKE